MNDLEKKESVAVTVSGKTIRLSCPVSEVENLQKAAQEVNDRIKKMRESKMNLSAEQFLIMTSIELAFDLAKSRDSKPQDEFTEKLKDIQDFLSSALSTNE